MMDTQALSLSHFCETHVLAPAARVKQCCFTTMHPLPTQTRIQGNTTCVALSQWGTTLSNSYGKTDTKRGFTPGNTCAASVAVTPVLEIVSVRARILHIEQTRATSSAN
jgi:hypothetical protein